MVERLSRGPASVSQLAEPLDMSLAAVVQHLGVLEGAGIVATEKVGRVRTCRLDRPQRGGLAQHATQWVGTLLDRLAGVITQPGEDN